jgi:hypothetical protein
MRFRIEQHLAAPLEAVEDAYVDPDFIAALGRLPKLGDPALVRQEVDGDRVEQWVAYRFTGELNAAVRRFIDPRRLTWVEHSTLDRSTHTTTWEIRPDHYASMLRCAGTFRLEPDGAADDAASATRRVAEGDIKVNVPLVGSKAEKGIVSGLEEHAALEAKVLGEWLAGRHGP